MIIRKVNILGDSITCGYAPITGEELPRGYSEILKEKRKNIKKEENKHARNLGFIG